MFAFLVIRGGSAINSEPHKTRIYQRTRKREPPSLRVAHNGDSVFAPAMNMPAVQKQAVRSVRRQLFRAECGRADTQESERVHSDECRRPSVLEDPRPPHLVHAFRARENRATTSQHAVRFVVAPLHPWLMIVRCLRKFHIARRVVCRVHARVRIVRRQEICGDDICFLKRRDLM